MVANNGGRYSFFYLEQSIFWEQLIGYIPYKKATGIVYFNLGGIFVETSKPKLFSTKGSNMDSS